MKLTLQNLVNYFQDLFKAKDILQNLCIEKAAIQAQGDGYVTYLEKDPKVEKPFSISFIASSRFRKLSFDHFDHLESCLTISYEGDIFWIEYKNVDSSGNTHVFTYQIQGKDIIGEETIFIKARVSLPFHENEVVIGEGEIENNLQSLKTLSDSLPFVQEALLIQSQNRLIHNQVFTFFSDGSNTSRLPPPLVKLVLEYADIPTP